MVAILVLAILTVIGIALMLITSTETRIAANEWSVNRAFYSSDAGVRWASAQLTIRISRRFCAAGVRDHGGAELGGQRPVPACRAIAS